jgi:hypothetical protein
MGILVTTQIVPKATKFWLVPATVQAAAKDPAPVRAA